MQGRVKQLRMSFGLDQRAFADLLGSSAAQVEAWEKGAEALSAEDLALMERRFGVSPRWLEGADVPIWGERVLELRHWLGQQVTGLTGARLVKMISATTGERIAYLIGLLQKQDPQLFTLGCVACWLGLTPGSTTRLLRGELDPGSPVIARASDLTGVPERWFRLGPEDLQ
jgi:DNA-binding transcriptional regulator YdaS (Cro superfamily)